jgi:hypothetical protein
MRNFRQMLLSLSICFVLLAVLAWIGGVSTDTLTDGLWHSDGDHPTNWLDASEHPDATTR